MDYYIYNTDVRFLKGKTRRRFRNLIDGNFAAAGGPRRYGKNFNKLKINDVLLMYVNKIGIVAVGKVQELWDGNSYTAPLYYTMEEIKAFGDGAFEYRITVNWYQDFSDKPITAEHMRQSLVPLPPRALSKIKRKTEVEEMLRKLQTILRPTPKALDLEVPSTERVEVQDISEPTGPDGNPVLAKHLRYERNSTLINKIKKRALAQNKMLNCQVCKFSFLEKYGEIGEGFIEAHHKKPLSEIKRQTLKTEDDFILVCS